MAESTPFAVLVTEQCVKFLGEVDMTTAPSLIEAIVDAPHKELDLSEVTFMDSSGLHALIRMRREQNSLRICAVSRPVQRLFELAGVTDILLDARFDSTKQVATNEVDSYLPAAPPTEK